MPILLVVAFAAGCGGTSRPAPPYPVFDGLSFEPSAAAYDPATDRFLVLSDQDYICYRYALKEGRLALGKGERHRELRLPGGAAALKFEAMTRLAGGSFLALTAFDRPDPDFRRLVRFRFALAGPIEAETLEFPEGAVAARLRALDPDILWWKVEGLSTTAGDRAALVAIRSVGKTYLGKRDVVWVLRCPRTERGYGPPERLIRFDARATVGREEGASSIERDPRDGSYLLLTSYESDDNDPAAHGAHLFRLPAAALEGGPPEPAAAGERPAAPAALPKPLLTFAAKAEGLAVTPEGRVLVVFDDDGLGWKGLFSGYDRAQGLFVVIEPGALGAPPAAAAAAPR